MNDFHKQYGDITRLTEKASCISTYKASCSVTTKKVTVSIPLGGQSGFLIVQGYNAAQRFTVLLLVCYTGKLIEWSNANLYENSSCTVSGTANSSITVTISANQIVGTEKFNVTACMYG